MAEDLIKRVVEDLGVTDYELVGESQMGSTFEHLECEPLFDSYFERLIDVAKRDPDIHNKRKFSDFLQWANEEGIIDKNPCRCAYQESTDLL